LKILRDILLVIGVLLIVGGLAMFSIPAALIVGGLVLVAVPLLHAVAEQRKAEREAEQRRTGYLK
jgi:hypothetical protein